MDRFSRRDDGLDLRGVHRRMLDGWLRDECKVRRVIVASKPQGLVASCENQTGWEALVSCAALSEDQSCAKNGKGCRLAK